MAILGWSYGGYAALQSAVVEPGLFKAIVAIAPVTDLQQAKEDFRHYTASRNVAEYIGSGPHIVEGSPLRNAAAIRAPVLLFHGDRDLNVNVVHSRRMDDALRDAGRRASSPSSRGSSTTSPTARRGCGCWGGSASSCRRTWRRVQASIRRIDKLTGDSR